jgi:hypothetical protein
MNKEMIGSETQEVVDYLSDHYNIELHPNPLPGFRENGYIVTVNGRQLDMQMSDIVDALVWCAFFSINGNAGKCKIYKVEECNEQ